MRRAIQHISEESLLDRSRRKASGKRVTAHALGLLGANLVVAPPCLLGFAAGRGTPLATSLPYALAAMALGIVVLRAALRLLHR